MLEVDLLGLLDEGHTVEFGVSGDLYIVELDKGKTGHLMFYGALLREAMGKAVEAVERSHHV